MSIVDSSAIIGKMKRKIGLFIGLLGIISLAFGGVRVFSMQSSKQGMLRVNSVPVASTFLGNKHIGRTPIDEKADAGEYTIKLSPESTTPPLASWQGTIHVAPNLLTYVNASLAESEFATAVDILWLEKISGKQPELFITTNPDGATVALDGDTKGISPITLTNVSSGDHMVSVSAPGFAPRSVKAKITPGFRVVAQIKLALTGENEKPPEASASPSITPTTTPKATPTKSAGIEPVKPYALIKDTPTGFLRVRMEPSTSSTEAGRVNPGEKYSIYDSQNGWFQIKYDGANKGWISGQYADKIE